MQKPPVKLRIQQNGDKERSTQRDRLRLLSIHSGAGFLGMLLGLHGDVSILWRIYRQNYLWFL